MSKESATGTTTVAPATTAAGLRPNAVGFVGVLIQSVALLRPGAAITGLLTFFGVRLSIRTLVVLGAIEVLVFTVLSVFLVSNPPSGNTLDAFTPAAWGARGGISGVLVGAVIGVLFFNGFESAVLLAEESKNSRKIIQPVLLIAVVFTGGGFVLASYAGLAGFGFDSSSYLADTSGSPWFTLGAP